ncbi:MAG: cytochrome c peroxidase [Roseibium sp.]
MKVSVIQCAAMLCSLAICVFSNTAFANQLDDAKKDFVRPDKIPFPDRAPYSLQIATLGKMLFYEPRLSGAQNMNCASCHNPSFGYETPVATAIGAANEPLGRHAPTTLNLAWTEKLFWDGRADSLEEQAAGPITAAVEMNGKFDVIVERLSAIEEYDQWFNSLFPGDGVTRETILTAIATYERTIMSGTAPFDRWVDGDDSALNASEIRGFEIFLGKANCAACHTGWNFTDNAFHDIGIATDDVGRAALDDSDPGNKHAFKTPGLRNLKYRAPFMHNGSVPNMESVIAYYETGGVERPSRSEKIKPFSLTGEERKDLVAFLAALTAEKTETPIPVLPN